MSKGSSFLRNIGSNVSGYIISVCIAFIIAPVTIHNLGDTRYGAWSLISELIGYYGLLDLGLRGAVTYYFAKYKAEGQPEQMKGIVSSGFWMLALLGSIVIGLGIVLSFNFQHVFKAYDLNLREVRSALMIMSFVIGLSLPMNAFNGALVGSERFDVSTGIEIVTRILTAAATFIAMKLHQGIVELALIQAGGRVIAWSLTVMGSYRVIGGLFIAPARFSIECVGALFKYGFRNAVGVLAQLVIYRMDLIVVGMFASVGLVTYYSIGGTLVSYASALCLSISFVFTPRFTQLMAVGRRDEVAELYIKGMRGIGVVAACLGAGILTFGKDFIRLWLGPAYVQGPWTRRSDIIMAVLMVANLPRMFQHISWQLLFATARVRFLMWLNLCEAAANLCLSILLVKWIGPIGAAFGTLFPLMVSHVLVLPHYVCRVIDIPLSVVVRKGLGMAFVVGCLMVCVGSTCLHFVPAGSWGLLFAEMLVTTACGGGVYLFCGVNLKQRQEGMANIRKWLVG